MDILFSVCARAGSKGVKNKNVKPFLGQPLAYYALSCMDLFIKKYKDEGINADICLNTDSEELKQLVKNTNLDVIVVERKPELAGDICGKLDPLRDGFKQACKITGKDYFCFIDLDLTSPLRGVIDVKNALDMLIADKECDLVTSVTSPRCNPYFDQIERKDNGYVRPVMSLKGMTARQIAPKVYDMNAAIYVYSRKFMEQNCPIFDGKVLPYEMRDTIVLDIDEEKDFKFMQILGEVFFNEVEEYKEVRDNIKNILK